MIRWSDSSLDWRYFGWLLVILTIVGCGRDASEVAPSQVDATQETQRSEVAQPETAATPEVAKSDVPAAGGQPATATDQAPAASSAAHVVKKPKVALSVPDPPQYVYEPKVVMAQRDADTCLVKVGDPFPVAALPGLDGQQHSLKELFGEKLTVIVFWSRENRLAREQIKRLDAETVMPFERAGVNVIAIHVADLPEQIREVLPAEREAAFTALVDNDASLFAKVATGRLPRTYLLDDSGQVLWLDIEYSRSMARNLANAVHVYLGGGYREEENTDDS